MSCGRMHEIIVREHKILRELTIMPIELLVTSMRILGHCLRSKIWKYNDFYIDGMKKA